MKITKTLLNNQWVKKKWPEKQENILRPKKENIIHPILRDATKVVFTGKFIAVSMFINKEKISQKIPNLLPRVTIRRSNET